MRVVRLVDESVTEFVAAVEAAHERMDGIRARLAAATVPDTAFGRLFEAHAVREAYHQRLPALVTDLSEAAGVLAHLVHGLRGVPRQRQP